MVVREQVVSEGAGEEIRASKDGVGGGGAGIGIGDGDLCGGSSDCVR